METSNIFKLNAMVTYNQGNYFNQLSMTNYLERKEIKTKENGELPHLHFQDRGIYVLPTYNLPRNVVMYTWYYLFIFA